MTNAFREMENHAAFSRVSSYTITHPKKKGYAVINVAYPKDGAGRLSVFIQDCFGELCETTNGTAGGYGYDKFTAAINGLSIDGKLITDHCHKDKTSERLLKAYGKAALAGDDAKAKGVIERARKQGYSFANWSSNGGYKPNPWNGYQDCYKDSGLDYLRALGYRIIKAL